MITILIPLLRFIYVRYASGLVRDHGRLLHLLGETRKFRIYQSIFSSMISLILKLIQSGYTDWCLLHQPSPDQTAEGDLDRHSIHEHAQGTAKEVHICFENYKNLVFFIKKMYVVTP